MPAPTSPPTVVVVDGHRLSLTNLEKVLYRETGTTKGDVIAYYSAVAPAILPALGGRPVTMRRFPNGTDEAGFYAKNVPAGTPPWVSTALLPAPGSTRDRDAITYPVLDSPAALVWSANLAALELHVPQWRVAADGSAGLRQAASPDLLVVDLDPGAPADVRHCCQVALAARTVLRETGLEPLPKTSGSKGLQLLARLPGTEPASTVSEHAHALALHLERSYPHLVVSRMTKSLRPGRVLVDWSQNAAAKTTVAAYSLRARSRPTASTPVTWDEVEACAQGRLPLVFEASDVLDRLHKHGDLLAPLWL